MSDGDQQAEFAALVRAVRDHVEAEANIGARWFPAASAPAAPIPQSMRGGGTTEPEREVRRPAASSEATRKPAVAEAPQPTGEAPEPTREPGIAAASDLSELSAAIGDCRRCKLAAGRTHIVFGVGNQSADLMFVGEGPGRDEDLQGEPFVGRAGQLLTEILTKGMKLSRDDVYIANVIKCRPPQNRNPEPDEIDKCIPFLQRQIDLVQPRVIVALGKFAAQTLLSSKTPITRMRGEWHSYRGVKVMPTLHPAYLLRNPADKRLVWSDVKQVMAELGLPI